MRQIFLDTETTGLSPAAGHRIVEIACIEVVSGKLTGREFHHYIDQLWTTVWKGDHHESV